ncbi:MAG: protein kinase [Deltaproteobacteria bacterium]|nr:protein kinase [Deltaproteobacteria bacterium]
MTDDGNADTLADPEGRPSGGSLVRPPERYVMRTILGRGGMGEVWLARDVRIDRDIAIKLMRRDRSQSPDAVARFLREARVQGRLEHPSIVPVHDLGEEDAPYFAMKRLTGTTLADAITDPAKWPRRTLLTRLIDVCLAIELAHQRGVIHRDLKPANIMLGDFGESYVLDWGLARIAGESDLGKSADLVSGESQPGHTVAGEMLGTPGYMSPEQMRGDPVDGRTDVYALGCILHEVLTGKPAVPRDQTLEVTLTAQEHRPSRHDPDVPPELDDLCARATAAEPGARVATARALGDAIQHYLDGDRDLERRKLLAAEHARRAAEVFAERDDAATRAEAMRQAGRAIALDPSNAAAQETLARLLLTPPREMPPAAQEKIEQERRNALRGVYVGGALAYLTFALVVPLAYFLGARGTGAMVTIAAFAALLSVTCTLGLRYPGSRALAYAVLAEHASLMVATGLLLGSLFLVPILVFGTLPIGIMLPILKRPLVVVVAHTMSFVVPLGAELLHLVPRTFELTARGILLAPPYVTLPAPTMLAIEVLCIFVQLLSVSYILYSQRAAQDRAQEQLHVQAWQLAQLVRT